MKISSMRTAYGEALVEIGEENENVVVLEADLSKATKTSLFAEKFPERFYNIGIAEQNMMSMAAGFASCGKTPFATALAVFASMRACEQVRTSICIGNMNVKIGAPYGGLCTAENGPTHQCISDIGIMRSFPNMTVLAPSDAQSCRAAVRWASVHKGPVYIRVLRDAEPVLYAAPEDVSIRDGNRLMDGRDVGIVANGFMVHVACEAARLLRKEGIHAAVHDLISIKPLPLDIILDLARKCGKIITVEEHTVLGGMGGAVAEYLCQNYPVPMKIMGINDFFGDSGDYASLLKKAGLTAGHIVGETKKLLGQRKIEIKKGEKQDECSKKIYCS